MADVGASPWPRRRFTFSSSPSRRLDRNHRTTNHSSFFCAAAFNAISRARRWSMASYFLSKPATNFFVLPTYSITAHFDCFALALISPVRCFVLTTSILVLPTVRTKADDCFGCFLVAVCLSWSHYLLSIYRRGYVYIRMSIFGDNDAWPSSARASKSSTTHVRVRTHVDARPFFLFARESTPPTRSSYRGSWFISGISTSSRCETMPVAARRQR